MSFIDFIGFIVTMLLLFFWIMRQAWQVQKKPQKEAEEIKEPSEELRQLLRSLDIELKGEEPKPPPPPKPEKKLRYIPSEPQYSPPVEQINKELSESEMLFDIGETVEEQDLARSEKNAYRIDKGNKESRVRKIINELPSKRNLILLKEILDKPKGLQEKPWHEYTF